MNEIIITLSGKQIKELPKVPNLSKDPKINESLEGEIPFIFHGMRYLEWKTRSNRLVSSITIENMSKVPYRFKNSGTTWHYTIKPGKNISFNRPEWAEVAWNTDNSGHSFFKNDLHFFLKPETRTFVYDEDLIEISVKYKEVRDGRKKND